MSDLRIASLQDVATTYISQARRIDCDDLRKRQQPPFGSLAFGAAGLAWFFQRAAASRADDSLLDDAERWARWVEKAPRSLFVVNGLTPRKLRSSLYCGPDGALFARIVVSHARGESYDDAARAFAARCRTLDGAPAELLLGASGYLAGAQALFGQTGDERFRRAADDVATSLVSQGARWHREEGHGFAHGQAGVLRSLVRWRAALARKGPLRDRVNDVVKPALERVAHAEAAARRLLRTKNQRDLLARSWCNGATGLALLWASAWRWEANPIYLARARGCGRRLLSGTNGAGADLCCGHAGRAYALLALDGIDEVGPWREVALKAGRRAARAGGHWPNGVLKGFPGVALLASDLASRLDGDAGEMRFPLID